jgi:hypothetical protein
LKGAVKKVSRVILKSEAMKNLRTKKTEGFRIFQTFVQGIERLENATVRRFQRGRAKPKAGGSQAPLGPDSLPNPVRISLGCAE